MSRGNDAGGCVYTFVGGVWTGRSECGTGFKCPDQFVGANGVVVKVPDVHRISDDVFKRMKTALGGRDRDDGSVVIDCVPDAASLSGSTGIDPVRGGGSP